MGLRIRTNVSSLVAQRHLSATQERSDKNYQRLASGFRINRAADDAAGLAISEKQRAKIRSLEQARRNASDGVSFVQVAEGGMNEITNILIRLRELAVQSASDTTGNRERAYTNREYTELVREVERIANATEFNGVKPFQGPDENNGLVDFTIHVGAGPGKVPNTDTIIVDLNEMMMRPKQDLDLNDESEIGPRETGEDFDRETAASKITDIDSALNKIAGYRATLGAKQSRLSSAIANLGIEIENLNSAKSRVKDVDFASETARLTQNRILATSGVSVLTQANQAPELALSLLR